MSHRMVFLLPMSSCMRAKLEIRPLSLANFQQKFPRNLMLCTTTLPPMGMHDVHRLFAIVLASGHWEPGLADTSSQTLWSKSEEGIRYGKRDMPPEFPGSVKYLGPCWSLALTGSHWLWFPLKAGLCITFAWATCLCHYCPATCWVWPAEVLGDCWLMKWILIKWIVLICLCIYLFCFP